jgi:hypothetical protein
MALIRLTPEIAETLSKSMGISPQQIREAINKGTLIGGKPLGADSRIYQIDDKYLPKELPQQIKVETSEDAKTELQSIADKIEIAKKQIELDEINKIRQKPKELQEREEKLNKQSAQNIEKENALILREKSIIDKELEIATTLEEAHTKTLEAQRYCTAKAREANQTIDQTTERLKGMQSEIDKQTIVLNDLQNKIQEYPTLVQPLKDELQNLIGIASKKNNYHYRQAEVTKGNVSDWHTNRSNRFWGLEKEFKKLLRWLG